MIWEWFCQNFVFYKAVFRKLCTSCHKQNFRPPHPLSQIFHRKNSYVWTVTNSSTPYPRDVIYKRLQNLYEVWMWSQWCMAQASVQRGPKTPRDWNLHETKKMKKYGVLLPFLKVRPLFRFGLRVDWQLLYTKSNAIIHTQIFRSKWKTFVSHFLSNSRSYYKGLDNTKHDITSSINESFLCELKQIWQRTH